MYKGYVLARFGVHSEVGNWLLNIKKGDHLDRLHALHITGVMENGVNHIVKLLLTSFLILKMVLYHKYP